MFTNLNTIDRAFFLFNNVDPLICKKLGPFIFEGFQRRKWQKNVVVVIVVPKPRNT